MESENAEKRAASEIEVTPEMIEAAALALNSALYNFPVFSRYDLEEMASCALEAGLAKFRN